MNEGEKLIYGLPSKIINDPESWGVIPIVTGMIGKEQFRWLYALRYMTLDQIFQCWLHSIASSIYDALQEKIFCPMDAFMYVNDPLHRVDEIYSSYEICTDAFKFVSGPIQPCRYIYLSLSERSLEMYLFRKPVESEIENM